MLRTLLLPAIALLLAALSAGPVAAGTERLCLAELPRAEREFGIPRGILTSIAFVEAGHRGTVWPWTLNIDGQGQYPETRAEALRRMVDDSGEMHRAMAVGCMQIFVRYHGDHFRSPQHMLDPRTNVRYAARFLRDLYLRHGTWTEAVAHYHASPRNRYAQTRYVCRVLHHQVALGFGRLTRAAMDHCSGRYRRYLDVARLAD